MKVKRTSRAGRKLEIYKCLYELNRSMTMYQIARHFGLAPSTHVQKILQEMCDDGDLDAWETQHRSNSIKRYYYVRALANGLSQMSLPL